MTAEVLPEVQCPGCGTTIRARMADGPGQAARVAQLERVAELAREAVESELGTDASGPVWDLGQALTDLDQYPETREE